MPETTSDIAIVGGGFAGTVTAIKLLRAVTASGQHAPLTLTLIESRAEIGRGIAYSTDNPDHIVNGTAQLFGLYPDQPTHLPQWLARHAQRHGWTPPPGVAEAGFLEAFPPRWLYGSYLQDELRQAAQDAGALVRLETLQGRVVDLLPQAQTAGHTLLLEDGRRLSARRVVLALGLFRKGEDRFVGSPEQRQALGARYIDDVWNVAAWQGAAQDEDILLIGSSLTALDAAFSADRAGFKGQFHALSRHGLLVQPRRAQTAWPDVLDGQRLPATLRELLRATRAARRSVRAAGADWQHLPPAIRPHVPALWAKASPADRRRFLRHLRPFWEISLHRAGPESSRKLAGYQQQGRLRQLTGRLHGLQRVGDKVAVQWTPRGQDTVQTLLVDRVANAAGYEFDWQHIRDPLVTALQRRRLVRRHATGFGIDADPGTGALYTTDGQLQEGLFAVGHPLRGVNWESNAIGEQLAGATLTAHALAAALHAASTALQPAESL
ncbi:FAD/NAD(P)-binding protein [Herbaspirillum sp. NPDC087042]|uniref:FAD/NAD(P)-binding protein n=1 Tax=Herbaspirillum sp. NPDC087042 TaxID=3364004 RepID=UPI0038012530